MSISAGGDLWDMAAKKHKSIRDYGEFCDDELAKFDPMPDSWLDMWKDRVNGTHKYKVQVGTRVVSLFFPVAERGLPCGIFDFGTRSGMVLEAVIVPFLVKGFGVFMMRQYAAAAVSDELIEAARVDGCSTWRVYWNVVLPALRPAAAVLGLLTFMETWNEFLWPYIVLDSDTPTVQVSLQILASGYYKTDYVQVFTGTALAIVPLLLVFVAFGRQIIGGIMEGSVKA